MLEALLILLLGAATGMLAGTLGAGGGFATVTVLLAAGLGNQEAVGTSLLFIAVIGGWGAALHFRQGTFSAPVALALGVPAAATAFFAAKANLSDMTFNLTFAAITAATAASLKLDDLRARRRAALPPPISGGQDGPAVQAETAGASSGSAAGVVRAFPAFRPSGSLLVRAVCGGAAIGLLQGLFGVGGGFVLVPFMILVLSVPERIAVGSSLLAIMLGSTTGGIRHAMLGHVDWTVLLWLLPGGLVCSMLGARLVPRLSPRTIRMAFVVLLATTTTFLVVRAFL